MDWLKKLIRDVPDFPKQGIMFKDITPLLQNPEAFKKVISLFIERYKDKNIDAIVAIEARGFLFGTPLASALNVPFVPVRKKGKLPYKTISESYELEYSSGTVEMHEDALKKGQRVLVIDDLLATGGTANATCNLVAKQGGEVIECAFVIELDFLKGREKIEGIPVYSLINY